MSGNDCVFFKVMLVEDDDGFRRSLAGPLMSRFPAIVLDEEPDGAEAMEKVKSFLPQRVSFFLEAYVSFTWRMMDSRHVK